VREVLGEVEVGEQPVELCQARHEGELLAHLATHRESLEIPRDVLAELPDAFVLAEPRDHEAGMATHRGRHLAQQRVRLVGEAGDPSVAAISTALAAQIYGLDVLLEDVEDHPENQTRFVVVAREGIPAATGHDKSTIVIFQQADRPGSLLAILQEFAARSVNLTKLESRPTKRGLGDYCFLIDLEGHLDDELVADCLRDLKSKHDVKFLGSYPAAGAHGPAVRRDADVAWRQADEWLSELRGQVRH
jgi:prephenate dehydratase